MIFKVCDANGKDITEQEEWYIDIYGTLFFMTNDIDSPLQDAESFGYTYKMTGGTV